MTYVDDKRHADPEFYRVNGFCRGICNECSALDAAEIAATDPGNEPQVPE